MNIERFIGLAFSIGLLLLTLFVFLKPQIDYQQEQKIEVVSETIDLQSDNSMQVVEAVSSKTDDAPSENSVPKDKDLAVMNIDQSDFDLFVLRLHVLSSEDNAIAMVKKLEESGVIAFTEIFGENKDLHAVYAGPFIDENDIHNNIELIQKVAGTTKGEIFRWKL